MEPAHQTEVLGLLAEVAIAISAADVGGVFTVRGWSIEVALQAGVIDDVELARQIHDRGGWHDPRVD